MDCFSDHEAKVGWQRRESVRICLEDVRDYNSELIDKLQEIVFSKVERMEFD